MGTEKHYIVECIHNEDDKDCGKTSFKEKETTCAIHCHDNKNERCFRHCGKSWKCETESQAKTLKHTHITNELTHKPQINKIPKING